jgi:hypothetical protein
MEMVLLIKDDAVSTYSVKIFKGCQILTDGVADKDDKCPTVKGPKRKCRLSLA